MKPRDYFEILAFTAIVDRELHASELPPLRGFAERLQLSKEESDKVLAEVQAGSRPTAKLPEAAKERSTLFRHMARIAVADHRLAPEEMDLLVRVGQALGQDRAKVYDVVDRAMQEIGGPPVAAPGAPPVQPAGDVPELLPLPPAAAAPPPRSKARAPEGEVKLELMPVDEAAEEAPAAKRVVRDSKPIDPLARSDYAVLRDLSGNMRIVAVIMWLVPGALLTLGVVAGLLLAVFGNAPMLPTLVGVVLQGIQAAVILLIGVNTWAAAGKFGAAGTSRISQDPVRRIMAGLSHLHAVYRIQMILAVLAVVFFAIGMCLLFGSGAALLRNLR